MCQNGRDEIAAIVAAYCRERPEIAACYLFGLRAKGKARPHSDVDLAFLFRAGFSSGEYFALRMRYVAELSELLHRDVDTVLLNDANEVLAGQVFLRGIPVYGEDDDPVLRAFCRRKLPLIAEFAYYIDLRLASLRARYGGPTHG